MNRGCSICESDISTLRSTTIPAEDPSWSKLRIADLFSGCGGLSLGIQRAAHNFSCSLDVRLAVDSDQIAMDVYQNLFSTAKTICRPIEQILGGEVGSPATAAETEVAHQIGRLDILLGGPPCQGHSNLNNYSRRDDPRNGLYLRMARAAEILCPSVIIIENVPTVTFDVRSVVHRTVERLREIDYIIGEGVVDLSNLGVPQKRRRHVIIAVRDCDVDPQELVKNLETPICGHVPRSVRWAIEDLQDVVTCSPFDLPSQPHPINQYRIN